MIFGGRVPRFHKLVAIERFRYFYGWADAEARHPHSFGRRTVIYGANASGKSTIADIFVAIERAQSEESEVDERLQGVRFQLTDDDRTWEVTGDVELPPVFVFGREYINRNLREAFESPEALGAPLYVIGKAQADLDERIREASEALDVDRKRHGDLVQKAKDTDKQRSEVSRVVREDVDQLLGAYDRGRFNKTIFNKTRVAELMASSEATEPLSSEQLQQRLELLRRKPEDIPADVTLPRLPDVTHLEGPLDELVTMKVLSRSIDRLAADHDLAVWAERGMELHDVGDSCAFCDSPVRQERMEELERHFDASYRELQQKLDTVKTAVATADHELATAREELDRLATAQRPTGRWISENREGLDRYLDECQEWIQKAHEVNSKREKEPFADASWRRPPAPDSSPWERLSAEAQRENEGLETQRAELTSLQERAVSEVLDHIAATHRGSFDAAERAHMAAVDEREAASGAVTARQERLAELHAQQTSKFDGEELARRLSADLDRYLGHRQLTVRFTRRGERSGFQFLRAGHPAEHLSEGERGAIALLHFLLWLESKDVGDKLPDACVVIDDPVSSFDNDAIVGAFAYLVERFKDHARSGELACSQLIVLTHNFQFLQLWRSEFDQKYVASDKKSAQRQGGALHEVANRRAAVLELRPAISRDNPPRRYSVLRDLGGKRPGRSEYHLLFERVCHAVEDDEDPSTLLAGNAGRRLLESFVLWKAPGKKDLPSAARALGDRARVPREVIERIVKSLHTASHRTEVDVTSYQYVGSITEDLRATLRFIQAIDPGHYNGMCEANEVQPDLGSVSAADASL